MVINTANTSKSQCEYVWNSLTLAAPEIIKDVTGDNTDSQIPVKYAQYEVYEPSSSTFMATISEAPSNP